MRNLNDYIDQLKDLKRDNIGSWPTWVYGLFVVGLSVAILIGSYYYVVLPSRRSLANAQHHEQHLKQEFKQKHERVAHLAQYQKQLTHLKKSLKGLVSELPSKTEVPDLLRKVSKTRASNGLSEDLFKPLANKKHKFYVTLPNHLVVRGGYNNLARFVSDVAQLSRIVTVDSVDIHPVKNNPAHLTMSATLKTYRYIGNGHS